MGKQSKYIATLDLGTNTFNLAISEKNAPFPPVYTDEKAVFIGKGGLHDQTITPDALKRAQIVLSEYYNVLKKYNVIQVKAVATEAIRNAKNGDLILRKLDTDIPFSIEKISGDREAELIWQGVNASGLLSDKTVMIIDIGGASTEIIMANSKDIKWLKSYKIGVSRALEFFPLSNQPLKNELLDLQTYFIENLSDLKYQIEKYQPKVLIGTAGSFDTWRKILESNQEMNIPFYEFDQPALKLIINKINQTPYTKRFSIKGIPEIRRKTIVPAGVLAQYLLDIYNFKSIYQCSYSLAEGLMNEMTIKQF
jgi:exopolyphosphatase/guanosine-5'-triphosphate,3'-diphosphate pyrophosphatase